MKQLIVFLTLFIATSTLALSAEYDEDCDCTPPGSPSNSAVSLSENINSGLTQQKIDNLRLKVCIAMSVGKSDHSISIPERIKSVIINNTNIDSRSSDVDLQIANLWNKYSDQMICPSTNGIYPTQHVYKRAIALKVHEGALFDFFLKDYTSFPIDVNTVETLSDGRKETVLDYIDHILKDPDADNRFNTAHIFRLKKILERRFKGKRASEL